MLMRLIISVTSIIVFVGCSGSTDLRSNCIAVSKIIKTANDLLKTSHMEDVVENGKIIATRVYSDNSDSNAFLDAKEEQLKTHYHKIRDIYLSNGEGAYDALCAIAMINDFLFRLTGESIEDRCKYIRILIADSEENMPSEWFLNEFYAYIITPPGYPIPNWEKMSKKEKFEDMLKMLLIPAGKGQNCVDNEDS